MSERSVRCPSCPFRFARLVDAGDFHAYVCPACGWTKHTADRRPGNRPADVCALCDRAIDLTGSDHHIYVGPGWVHGGGRENIPIHASCADAIRAYLRTDTLRNDECSCPPAWSKVFERHMIWCQQREEVGDAPRQEVS